MGLFGGKKNKKEDENVNLIADWRNGKFRSNGCLFEIIREMNKGILEAKLENCKLFRNVKNITLSMTQSGDYVALIEYNDLKVKSGLEVDQELKRLNEEAGLKTKYIER